MAKQLGVETQAVHAGTSEERVAGAVVLPIFQSATFEHTGERRYEDLRYIRLSNTPNHRAVVAKLCALEGAEAGLVTASGMAAISTTLLSLLGPGDHVLAQRGLYGGTHTLLTRELAALGVACDLVDGARPDEWEAKARPETKVFYTESIANPLCDVPDLEAAVAFARRRGLVTVVDNTLATPLGLRPLALGFDLVVHSATKYLNGHSDIVAGAVVGGAERIERVAGRLAHLGGSLDPHACFLLERGMKTLPLRVRQQWQSAHEIACFLEEHPKVSRVYYPGLESHPHHARARHLFAGFGGLLSFEVTGGLEEAERVLSRLQLFSGAPSLGGVESLVTLPLRTSHAKLTPDERAALGIADGLVRLAVGLETTEDLVEDLRQALL